MVTDLSENPEGRLVLRRHEQHPAYNVQNKWLVQVKVDEERTDTFVYSMRDWQVSSGHDTHSLFADARYVDVMQRNFHLLPDSPNIEAGEDGTSIGALGVQPDGEGRKEDEKIPGTVDPRERTCALRPGDAASIRADAGSVGHDSYCWTGPNAWTRTTELLHSAPIVL